MKVNFPFFSVFLLVILAFQPVRAGEGKSEKTPLSLIQLPEKENAILVEKETQTLYIYSASQRPGAASGQELVFSARCSTGEVSGPKVEKGDKKTPEGIYFLVDAFEDKYLAPVYGKMAFPTDYPNFVDRRRGKNGSAIWIHGTDKALKPMDSNGCIALENENVMALSRYIRLNSTPLIIADQIQWEDPGKIRNIQRRISTLVEGWIQSLEAGDYHDFLGFYSPRYVPDISWWEEWIRLRDAGEKSSFRMRVTASNTGIYSHDDLYVVLMDLDLVRGEKTVRLGRKKLFFEAAETGYKIAGDMFQVQNSSFPEETVPLVAAARNLRRSQPLESDAVDAVKNWLAAWSAKNMDAYADFYAPEFRSEGMSRKAWILRKKALSKRYDYIRVSGEDFKISRKKDGLLVSFIQNYESSGFSTRGVKQLKLVNKGGSWKISQENWKGK